jgi:hypothetical protein
MSENHQPTQEPAHDVLAAEAFAVPTPDPSLHHGPVRLPDDPTGIAEPHDILAAEEFAMPVARASGVTGVLARRAGSPWRNGIGAAVVLLLLRRLRRR